MHLEIRPERAGDEQAIHEVHSQAFETEVEARLEEALRPLADPCISLVAQCASGIAGHALFTPVRVEQASPQTLVMGLGPMAVRPELQGRGIGGKLVICGIEQCRAIGADAIVVLGHADYYPRFGFQPARPYGLYYRDRELDPYFMVLELRSGALAHLTGRVHYLPPFEDL